LFGKFKERVFCHSVKIGFSCDNNQQHLVNLAKLTIFPTKFPQTQHHFTFSVGSRAKRIINNPLIEGR
jgi:hypothetical protein